MNDSVMHLLLVEDSTSDVRAFTDTVSVYNEENAPNTIIVKTAQSLDEAKSMAGNSFDGVIVDMKLGSDNHAGMKFIENTVKPLRVPTRIITGQPSDEFDIPRSYNIKVHTKGDVNYKDVLIELGSIFDTGITRIMGKRGLLESHLNEVFWNSIHSNMDSWIKHTAHYKRKGLPDFVHKSLLRHTLSHLNELINDDVSQALPNEVYISPIADAQIRTGAIVKAADDAAQYVVMNPACELANDKYETIILCLIDQNFEPLEGAIVDAAVDLDKTSGSYEKDLKRKNKASSIIHSIIRNNAGSHLHYLPPSGALFDGGLVNFQKTLYCDRPVFDAKFSHTGIQIAAPFIKDIVARFSAYFARQGQPNFDFDHLHSILSGS